MPLYTYVCPQCGKEEEHIVKYELLAKTVIMCSCGADMKKAIDVPKLGRSAFQMHAVMANGSHVPGHFGKTAKNK